MILKICYNILQDLQVSWIYNLLQVSWFYNLLYTTGFMILYFVTYYRFQDFVVFSILSRSPKIKLVGCLTSDPAQLIV